MSLEIIGGLIENIFEEGLIYGIMAIGVYITYSILDFPDLTVDGSFPLGGCVAAAMIGAGANPLLACLAALLCGMAAGCITGLLHVKCKITDLLSGILTMTALWSVNLVVTGGKSVLPFYDLPTIFNSGLAALLPEGLYAHRVVIIGAVCVIAVKLIVDLYLKTKSGLLLRAVGDNQSFVTSLGKDQGNRKILGLALGNGLVSLSGCVLAQQAESANITSGTGMVVMALASVIIGRTIFGRLRIMKSTTSAVIGACIYKACLAIAMQLGLPTNYLKLLMAAIFTAVLVSNNLGRKKHAEIR